MLVCAGACVCVCGGGGGGMHVCVFMHAFMCVCVHVCTENSLYRQDLALYRYIIIFINYYL